MANVLDLQKMVVDRLLALEEGGDAISCTSCRNNSCNTGATEEFLSARAAMADMLVERMKATAPAQEK